MSLTRDTPLTDHRDGLVWVRGGLARAPGKAIVSIEWGYIGSGMLALLACAIVIFQFVGLRSRRSVLFSDYLL